MATGESPAGTAIVGPNFVVPVEGKSCHCVKTSPQPRFGGSGTSAVMVTAVAVDTVWLPGVHAVLGTTLLIGDAFTKLFLS